MIHFKEENNSLYAKFVFTNFIDAFGFMSKVAIVSEKLNHHATIHNTYNKVELFLSTHDAGNIVTQKDILLAEEIEKLLV